MKIEGNKSRRRQCGITQRKERVSSKQIDMPLSISFLFHSKIRNLKGKRPCKPAESRKKALFKIGNHIVWGEVVGVMVMGKDQGRRVN